MEKVILRVPRLDGGLVTDVSPVLLDVEEGTSADLLNLDLARIGRVRKRPGVATVDLPPVPDTGDLGITGLKEYKNVATRDLFLLAAADDTIYYWDDEEENWEVLYQDPEVAEAPVYMLNMHEFVLVANGVFIPFIWDGEEIDNTEHRVPSPPRDMLFVDGHLFMSFTASPNLSVRRVYKGERAGMEATLPREDDLTEIRPGHMDYREGYLAVAGAKAGIFYFNPARTAFESEPILTFDPGGRGLPNAIQFAGPALFTAHARSPYLVWEGIDLYREQLLEESSVISSEIRPENGVHDLDYDGDHYETGHLFFTQAGHSTPLFGVYLLDHDTFDPDDEYPWKSGEVVERLDDPGDMRDGTGYAIQYSDGYIFVAHRDAPHITVHEFDGSIGGRVSDPAQTPNDRCYTIYYDEETEYIFVGEDAPPYFSVYEFQGGSFGERIEPEDPPEFPVRNIWYSDGRIFMTLLETAIDLDEEPGVWYTMYEFDADTGEIGDKLPLPREVPQGKYMTEYHTRAVMAGDPDYPFRLHMSDVGDPYTWNPYGRATAAVQAEIGTKDGEEITGLLTIGESGLLIGKEESLYNLRGWTRDNFSVDLLDSSVGVASHRSMQFVRPHAYFVHRKGIYRFQTDSVPERISLSIQDRFNDEVDKSKLEEATSALYGHRYILSCPRKGGGQIIFVYHTDQEKWSIWDEPEMTQTTPIRISDDEFYFAKDGDYQLYRMDRNSLTDPDNEPIASFIQTHPVGVQSPEVETDHGDLYFLFEEDPGTLVVKGRIDGGKWEKLGARWSVGDTGLHTLRVPVGKTARFLEVRLEQEDADKDLIPLSLSYVAIPKDVP